MRMYSAYACNYVKGNVFASSKPSSPLLPRYSFRRCCELLLAKYPAKVLLHGERAQTNQESSLRRLRRLLLPIRYSSGQLKQLVALEALYRAR